MSRKFPPKVLDPKTDDHDIIFSHSKVATHVL